MVSPFPSVEISALNGVGITVLQENIVEMADRKRVQSGNELIAINARHADSLARALSSLKDAADRISRDEPSELAASDLRQALESFGQIAGKVDNERMLDQLFASFCIGK
jgi:tRNA modification GTPase